MILTLTRIYYADDCTLGVLADGNTMLCYILERPWLDNQKNISCIPEGHYTCEPHKGKYKNTWVIQKVKGRSGILFHSGNVIDDSEGCLIPGSVIGALSGKRAVLGSRRALNKLRDYIGISSDFDLTIKGV